LTEAGALHRGHSVERHSAAAAAAAAAAADEADVT